MADCCIGSLLFSVRVHWRPLLSVSFVNIYILIFFSETTGPIGTKLGRNVLWKSGISSKKCMFFVNQRYMKETRGPNVSKGMLSVFVCGAFIFQPILMDIFVMFLIKLSLYSMLIDLLWLLPFPRYNLTLCYLMLFFFFSSHSSGCWAILCCEILFHWMVLPVSVQSIFELEHRFCFHYGLVNNSTSRLFCW